MDWNNDKSIRLSQACVYVFAIMLLAMDLTAPFWAEWFAREFVHVGHGGAFLLLTVYSGSIAGWICLWLLRRLLMNIRDGRVFVEDNVRCMRRISRCCAAAAAITLLSSLYYLPLIVIAIAAAFMMLIVRIVKNVFQQAIEMKSELDLTI